MSNCPHTVFSFSAIISDKKSLTLLTEGSGIFRYVSACYKTPKTSIWNFQTNSVRATKKGVFGISAVGFELSNSQKAGNDSEPSVTFYERGGARARADGLLSAAGKK